MLLMLLPRAPAITGVTDTTIMTPFPPSHTTATTTVSGRKRAALLYVAAYALSCATKHSRRYGALLVGRLLGGVATSLLFSVFEAWAVAAHVGRGFDESLLVRIEGGGHQGTRANTCSDAAFIYTLHQHATHASR